MKALSLTQPWASLVVTGKKLVETRSWRTDHTGRIAIHAAKGYPKWAKECASEWRMAGFVSGTLPLAGIIGTAVLREMRMTEAALHLELISAQEREFGDYSDHRYAWFLTDVVAFPALIPCKGALGLWDVPPEVLALFPRSAEHTT